MMNIKLIKKANHGMTLIEIILALAILGIIAVAFLGTFTFAFIQITQAGHKSTAGFKAQQGIDLGIIGAPLGVDATISPTTIIIELPFPLSTPMTQDGKIITVTSESNGKVSNIKTFIP